MMTVMGVRNKRRKMKRKRRRRRRAKKTPAGLNFLQILNEPLENTNPNPNFRMGHMLKISSPTTQRSLSLSMWCTG